MIICFSNSENRVRQGSRIKDFAASKTAGFWNTGDETFAGCRNGARPCLEPPIAGGETAEAISRVLTSCLVLDVLEELVSLW